MHMMKKTGTSRLRILRGTKWVAFTHVHLLRERNSSLSRVVQLNFINFRLSVCFFLLLLLFPIPSFKLLVSKCAVNGRPTPKKGSRENNLH